MKLVGLNRFSEWLHLIIKPLFSILELKVILAKADLAGSLMTLVEESNIEVEEKRRLLPVIVNRLSLMLFDCDLSCEQMEKEKGYERLFEIINGIGPPDMKTLKSVLSMATFGGDARSTADYNPVMIKNTKPINYLLKWICETDYENEDQQVIIHKRLRWLSKISILLSFRSI